MHDSIRKVLTALVALTVLTTAVGGVMAAATWDSETTTTSTQSDVTGSTTSIDVYYGDSSNATYFEVDGASTSNLTLEITPAENGVDYLVYQNKTPDTVNSANGHYAWNVSHDELADAPRDVDGASYDVRVINQSSGNEVLNSTGVTFNQANSDAKAVMVVTNATTDDAAAMTNLVADRLTISEKDGGLFGVKASDLNPFSSEENASDSVATWSGYTTVDGTNTTVEVVMDNSSAADAYDAAAEDTESGEWMTGATLFVNGIPHKVYDSSAPDDADGTTVVYDPDSDTLSVDTEGEDYQDVRTLSLRGTGNEGYKFGELVSNFGYGAAFDVANPF